MPGSATDGRYNSCDLASSDVATAYPRKDRNLTGLVVVVVTCAVLVIMAAGGLGLLVFARDVPVVERVGVIGAVQLRSSRYDSGSYEICLGAGPSCESFHLYPRDFRPRLPDLRGLRGSSVRLWIFDGTSDVVALDAGPMRYTSFASRHPESRAWLLRLWGAGLLFFPVLLVGVFAWAKTIGTRRARERPPSNVDELPRRGGGYLVSLMTAFILAGAAIVVFATIPDGSGQIANAFPPVVWLCWTWPVLIQNGLDWLGKRSRIPYVVERAEWLAAGAGIVAAGILFVLPFELLIAWDVASE
jgi:hypothetical protein